MSLFEIIESIFLGPLKLLFEVIFEIANRFVNNPGFSIIVLSLIMNILVLPLYKRADAMQEKARDIENKLHDGVAHIKKTFSGDERMMILQAYYRQNNYKPTDAFKGSISLLLEIPFFMAAYQFLSNLGILEGVSFGPITDLSSPDGLIVIGALTINLLPILMTVVNVVSSALYLKGFPLKTKIQLYGMALFFLIVLYNSPSGLVFYWTLNNLFSLVKTIFYKLKNPKKVLSVLTTVAGLGFIALGGFIYETTSLKRKVFLIGVGLILQLPLILTLFKAKFPARKEKAPAAPSKKVFVLGCLFLTVLMGLLIPSTFIAASPQEYVDITYFHNPLWYIASATCFAAGTFLVWMRVFYWLASPRAKTFFEKAVWIGCGATLVNYMFFGTNLGIISASLKYDNPMVFTRAEQLLNIAVLIVLAVVFFVVIKKWGKIVAPVLLTAVIAFTAMSVVNINKINSSVELVADMQSQTEPNFNLSRNGQNVVVIMVDRAAGEYIPYLLNEKPELAEKFDGFTYYSNTISFGGHTSFGIPALLGGYEYTPVELNKRDDESLKDKHNEALKVMPHIFSEAGYDVTVFDPSFANYQWIPDLSIYDEYENVDAYITMGYFNDPTSKQIAIDKNKRNFFTFSLMKTMPVITQPVIYCKGTYNQSEVDDGEEKYGTQVIQDIHTSTGIDSIFMNSYNVMKNMSNITKVTDDSQNNFLFMTNKITHDGMILQTPDYVPSQSVDNTQYDSEHTDRFTVDGKTLNIETTTQYSNYHANMAAMLLLADWFDYLRENDVYDNTKIILVADHANSFFHFEELVLDENRNWEKNVERYYPLLMVKDFNSTGFTTCDDFMTNADVPSLAMKDVISNPTNPFTGNAITTDEKTAHDQIIIRSGEWDILVNNGNTYLPSRWASVKDDLWDPENWKFYDKEIVLKEHALPEE